MTGKKENKREIGPDYRGHWKVKHLTKDSHMLPLFLIGREGEKGEVSGGQ